MSSLFTGAFADGWAAAIFQASWQGGIAVALVWITCAIAPSIPPRIQCWLWRLAALKLVLGLVWSSPIALPVLPARISAAQTSFTQPLSSPNSSIGISPQADSLPDAMSFQESAHPAGFSLKCIETLAGRHWIGLAWMAGVSIGCFRLAWKWRRARRLCREHTTVVGGDICVIIDRLCRKFDITHPPQIVFGAPQISPVLVGLFRPVILLPGAWADSAAAMNLWEMALAHELAHFRRRDILWSWLVAIAGVLFFFHPLAWVLRDEFEVSTDAACDAEALRMAECDRRSYAELLLDLATNHSGIRVCGFGGLAMIESIGTLQKRLRHLMHSRAPHQRTVFVAGMLIAAFAIPGLMNWKLVPRAIANDRNVLTALTAGQKISSGTLDAISIKGLNGLSDSSEMVNGDNVLVFTTFAKAFIQEKNYPLAVYMAMRILKFDPTNKFSLNLIRDYQNQADAHEILIGR